MLTTVAHRDPGLKQGFHGCNPSASTTELSRYLLQNLIR